MDKIEHRSNIRRHPVESVGDQAPVMSWASCLSASVGIRLILLCTQGTALLVRWPQPVLQATAAGEVGSWLAARQRAEALTDEWECTWWHRYGPRRGFDQVVAVFGAKLAEGESPERLTEGLYGIRSQRDRLECEAWVAHARPTWRSSRWWRRSAVTCFGTVSMSWTASRSSRPRRQRPTGLVLGL